MGALGSSPPPVGAACGEGGCGRKSAWFVALRLRSPRRLAAASTVSSSSRKAIERSERRKIQKSCIEEEEE